MTSQQAAAAAGITVGVLAAVLGAPLWGVILLGSGGAIVVNKAIQGA